MELHTAPRGRGSLIAATCLGGFTFVTGGRLSFGANPMKDDMWLFPLIFFVGPLAVVTLIVGFIGFVRARGTDQRLLRTVAALACVFALLAVPIWTSAAQIRTNKELAARQAETDKGFAMSPALKGYRARIEAKPNLTLTGGQLKGAQLLLVAEDAPYPPDDEDMLDLPVTRAANPTVLEAVREASGSLPCTITLEGLPATPAVLREYALGDDPAGEAFVRITGKSARVIYEALAASAN